MTRPALWNRPLLLPAALLLLAAGSGFVGSARADVTAQPPAEPAAAVEPPPTVEIPPVMQSPRAVVEAFITRMQEDDKKAAAELLDLSKLSAIAAESRGADLALKLYRLIPALGTPPMTGDQDVAVAFTGSTLDFTGIPDQPDTPSPWSITVWLDNERPQAEQVTLARDDKNRWRFSAATVAVIDEFYEATEEQIDEIAEEKASSKPAVGEEEVDEPTETRAVWLRKLFPPSMRKTYFLLPNYQWLLLLLLLPLGRAAEKLTRVTLTPIGDALLRRFDPDFTDSGESTARVWRPLGRLMMAAVWAWGAYTIGIPSEVTNILLIVLVVVTAVTAVLAFFRVIDLFGGYFLRRAKRSNRRFDDLLIPLAASTVKIVALLATILATIAALSGELPSTLIGGLGIGGIAIALASQETLSNFIGSLTLLFDRPFEVGDWIIVDAIEGEVESLGFRSTRIRTGPNSQITLPNSKLVATSVDNLGRRKYRRYLSKLGLEYGTPPERIEAFCEGIRELVRRHPHTRKDFYAAYFNDFGPSSLDVIVVVFFEAPDWVTELRERHRLLADILRLADEVGVAFAFPTQTLHLHRGEADAEAPDLADDSPDLAGARAAAEIAGELPNYQDRPGRVKFTGPTPLD